MNELKSHPWGCQGMLDVVVRLDSGDIRVMSVSDDIPPEHIPLKDKILWISKQLRFIPALIDDRFVNCLKETYECVQQPLDITNASNIPFVYSPISEMDFDSLWIEFEGFPEGYIYQGGTQSKFFSFKDYVMYKKVHRA